LQGGENKNNRFWVDDDGWFFPSKKKGDCRVAQLLAMTGGLGQN